MAVIVYPPFFKLNKNNFFAKNDDYSISYVLRTESRSNDEFEVMLNNLSLEEVISLKLELSGKVLKNKPYGLQVWKILPHIIWVSVLRFALAASRSKTDAADFLGITKYNLKKKIQLYQLEDYFITKEQSNGTKDSTSHS